MGRLKVEHSKIIQKMFVKLYMRIQNIFYEKILLFVEDFHHPSLRVKKMKGYTNPELWDLSRNMNFRVTFEIHEDLIFFRKIGDHEILKTP